MIISKNEKCPDDDIPVKFDITNITFPPVVGIYIDDYPRFPVKNFKHTFDNNLPVTFKDYYQMLSMVNLNMTCSTDCKNL